MRKDFSHAVGILWRGLACVLAALVHKCEAVALASVVCCRFLAQSISGCILSVSAFFVSAGKLACRRLGQALRKSG